MAGGDEEGRKGETRGHGGHAVDPHGTDQGPDLVPPDAPASYERPCSRPRISPPFPTPSQAGSIPVHFRPALWLAALLAAVSAVLALLGAGGG